MRSRTVVLLVISFALLPVASSADDSDSSKMVAELMAKSGLDKQLHQMFLLILSELEQTGKQRPDLPPADLNTLRGAVMLGFDPKELRPGTAHYLTEHLPAQDMAAVLQWLGSPLGKKITQLEEIASTPEAWMNMQDMAAELTKNSSRVEKAKRLDRLTQATEGTVQMIIASQIALTAALAAVDPASTPPPLADITRRIEALRPEISEKVGKQTLVSMLYSYRTLSDGELEQYLAFADQDFSKRYHKVARDGVSRAVAQSMEKMTAGFVRSRGARGAKPG